MMGFGFRMEMGHSHRLTHSYEAKLHARMLLKQATVLRSPKPATAITGLDGLLAAHETLQENGAFGILIGSMAECVWNQRRKPEDLDAIKDVDVLVVDESAIEYDQAGIDWWLPHRGVYKISRYRSAQPFEAALEWWQNTNDVILAFGMKRSFGSYLSDQFTPGLIVPEPEWIVDMRATELLARVPESVPLAGDTYDALAAVYAKRLATRAPKWLRDELPGRFCGEDGVCKLDAISFGSVDSLDLSYQATIATDEGLQPPESIDLAETIG